MRPEAERRLREGFQRRVDEQSSRYAAQLADASQQAARFECGAVAGVFPGTLPLLGTFPFLAGAWIGVSFWRGRTPKRQVWLYAFTEGFMLLDDPPAGPMPVRWSQVTEVSQVWTNAYVPGDEDPTPTLSAYRLHLADGWVHEISRSFKNVQDPYREMGQLFRHLAPGTIGKTMPRFFTIDEIIATYAGTS